MRPTRVAMFVVVAVSLVGCSEDWRRRFTGQGAPAPDASASVLDARVASVDARPSPACLPLSEVKPEQCPPTWVAAQTEKAAFCANENWLALFDAFISDGSCGGFLRYTRHLFDAGPRYCIYDPTTLALRGYRAFDGKAFYEATTCGSAKTDFDDKGCAGRTCPQTQEGCNQLQRQAVETIVDVASSVQQCATAADCKRINVPFDCVDCVHLVGNDNVTAALTAEAASINSYCTAFKHASCKLIPSPCPPLTLDGIQCLQGKCVFPPGR